MNHIQKLTKDVADLRDALARAREGLAEIETYLSGAKFHGVDADWVGVSTDVLPKLRTLRHDILDPTTSAPVAVRPASLAA